MRSAAAETAGEPAQWGRGHVARLATAVLAAETVRHVAEVLAARGIGVMPLKGVLWQQWLYREAPQGRDLCDVDLLVAPGTFRAALRALSQTGWRLAHRIPVACVLRGRRALDVDLHERILPQHVAPGLQPQALFERAVLDTQTFGAPVWMPDPVDAVLVQVVEVVSEDPRGTGRKGRWRDLAALLRWVEQAGRAPALLRRARRLGVERWLARAVFLLRDAGRPATAAAVGLDSDPWHGLPVLPGPRWEGAGEWLRRRGRAQLAKWWFELGFSNRPARAALRLVPYALHGWWLHRARRRR